MANILKTNIGVRYYEDGIVNGQKDIDYEDQKRGVIPEMPCVFQEGKELFWRLEIDVETGVITNWPEGNTAKVHYKVCDCCDMIYYADGVEICDNNRTCCGYVPKFFEINGEGWGDYIILNIDENGKIEGWDKETFYEWVSEN